MMLKRRIGQWAFTIGWDPRRLQGIFMNWNQVRRSRRAFHDQAKSAAIRDFDLGNDFLIFGEESSDAGEASGHYFHQDLLVAREIYRREPRRHIDVGSRIDGFVAHVAVFREVEVLDLRPLTSVPGIRFVQADVMSLGQDFTNVADSVSCLHALEHFGLGRYGDPVNYDGWKLGLAALSRMLEVGGILYLSVPTGYEQRVEFNAHRIFSLPFLRDKLIEDFSIEQCAFVTDIGELIENVDAWSPDAERSFGATYGCSIWVLRKN